jgi:hypothetical protein
MFKACVMPQSTMKAIHGISLRQASLESLRPRVASHMPVIPEDLRELPSSLQTDVSTFLNVSVSLA